MSLLVFEGIRRANASNKHFSDVSLGRLARLSPEIDPRFQYHNTIQKYFRNNLSVDDILEPWKANTVYFGPLAQCLRVSNV